MARFDVYSHPDAALRKTTPFLVDVQNDYINGLDTRVVIPMRTTGHHGVPLRDLNPVFQIKDHAVVLDTAALAAFPARELGKCVVSLRGQSHDIVAALDCLFGGY